MKLIIAAVLILATGLVGAEEKQTPTDAFRGETQAQIMLCRITTKIALNKIQLGEVEGAGTTIGKCIKDGKIGARKRYPAALARVAKKPTAVKLLKDYYASWITAIDAVAVNVSDTKNGYDLRQDANDAKYDEIWNRFEIEAGI